MMNWYNVKACEVGDPYYGYVEFAVIGTEEDIKTVVELLAEDAYEVYKIEKWEDE